MGRCCRKSPQLLCGKFPAERRNTRRLLVDMPTGQLPKSLVSSSHCDASPHTIVGSPHLRLGKFVFSNAKRLFRQHRPGADIASYSIISSARERSEGGTVRPSALAVLRLITNSNLVALCTGRSAGFSPLRMRST